MTIKTLQIKGRDDILALQEMLIKRNSTDPAVEGPVLDILKNVRENGDTAVCQYTNKFDCPQITPDNLKVAPELIAHAVDDIPATDKAILEESIANVMDFHQRQAEQSWWTTKEDGTILGQMVRPLDRAGLYIPGGQGGETPLISSLIMNAVPAKVAGVGKIVVCSPPRKDGTLNAHILATASLLGIEDVYLCGSAWAVAAMAYGTKLIPRVDIIAGPGNIFVTTAKRLLVGQVGIDMIAGPSEVLVVADDSANPAWAAADLLSQAEHDPLAAAILVTTSPDLAKKVEKELYEQLNRLPRKEIAEKSIEEYGAIITVDGLDRAVDMINIIAPEHLELLVDDPWPMLGGIRHAGAIFMGHNTAEPIGDYFAGPNHVLPTLTTARFSSALSVQNFLKKSSVICTSGSYVAGHGDKIARLARLEGLEAHARSVECRLKK